MPTTIHAPAYPESVSEGTLMAWHRQVGDAVEADEKLADIETDKIVLEVAAPHAGVLRAHLKQEGDTVLSGEPLGELEEGAAGPEPAAPASAAKAAPAPSEDGTKPVPPAVSPAARKLLLEHGLTADQVPGSGRGGRITKADVLARIESPEPPEAPVASKAAEGGDAASAPAAPPPPITTPAPSMPDLQGDRPEERVAMTRIRARIAERLVEAQRTAAILTTFNEIDMKAVTDLRKKYRDAFEKEHEVRLGFMSFFVKASVEALKKFPDVNASIDGTDIIYHGYYDIGVAVSSPRGLVVPILRDADRLSFAEVESAVGDLAARARDNQLALEDLHGGTFSITNGGIFGSMLSTPILNPPQSAILGMHNIIPRPVAIDGQVEIRPVMYVALSYDHRLIDGRQAVQFLFTIKEMIEDPTRMLIGV